MRDNQTKVEVAIYSMYTAPINSNGSHFLTAAFLCTEHIRLVKWGGNQTQLEVTMYSKYAAHISSMQWKPLLDGLVLCVPNT